MVRVFTDLDDFNDKIEDHDLNLKRAIDQFIELCLRLIELFDNELSSENRNKKLIESIAEKYRAFCVFCYCQIIKKLDFLEENLISHS